MAAVVSDKPYVPVLPYHGTLWPRALGVYFRHHARKRYGTRRIDIVGAEKLTASINAGHGVLITPNHCRDEDPFVVAALAHEVRQPFFVVASAHLFMAGRVQVVSAASGGSVFDLSRGHGQAGGADVDFNSRSRRAAAGDLSRRAHLTHQRSSHAHARRHRVDRPSGGEKTREGGEESRRAHGRAAVRISLRHRRRGRPQARGDRGTHDLAPQPRVAAARTAAQSRCRPAGP